MRVVVLGGAGAMGSVIDRDLAASDPVDEVVVADLRLADAQATVDRIGSDKLEAAQVDVTDTPALRRLLGNADVAVNSTWYEFNVPIMETCMAAGVHYVDLGGLYRVTREQRALHEAARDADVTCLLGMGSTPGTMNVLAAHAAAQLDRLEALHLRSAGVTVSGRPPEDLFVPPYSIRTILDEFTLPVPVLRGGRLREVPPLTERVGFTLPDPVGAVEGFLTIHSELATLPETLDKGVQEMDFAVAFEPPFAEVLATLARLGLASRDPVPYRGQEVVPYDFVARVIDGLPKPSEEPLDVDVQRCEALGRRDGEEVRLVLDAVDWPREDWGVGGGAVGTGTPPSIAAQWIAQGRIRTRGAVPPEVAVDPLPYFRELHAGGRTVEVYQEEAGERRPLFVP